ncbi:MAG: hypothetical protein AAF389_14725 [Gemmatimonadota bacterium]
MRPAWWVVGYTIVGVGFVLVALEMASRSDTEGAVISGAIGMLTLRGIGPLVTMLLFSEDE